MAHPNHASPPAATDPVQLSSDPAPSSSSASASFDGTAPESSTNNSLAEAESHLLHSPPSTSTPLHTTSVTIIDERGSPSPGTGTDTSAPAGELSYSNVDGSTRVYRFPSQLPPRTDGGDTGSSEREREQSPARVVTVRDLRNKSCWICAEEDEDDTAVGAAASSSARRRRKRFVHPCNCTLVAHESCLLAWIEQSRINHPTEDTVACPQCKAPYILVESRPLLLRLFERLDKVALQLVPVGCSAVMGGSILVACSAYGCAALRLVLGRQAAQRVLASPWPWHYWFDIPLIPFALVASKLGIAELATTWIPTVLAYSLNPFPALTTHWLIGGFTDRSADTKRRYPPGPALLALLLPWIRHAYLALRRRTFRAVLAPYLRRRHGGNRPATGNATGRRRYRVVIGDAADAEVPRAMTLQDALHNDDDEGDDRDDAANNNNNDDGNNGVDEVDVGGATRTIVITTRSLGRMCLDALSLPLIANGMGKLLATLARRSRWLARMLGMEPFLRRSDKGVGAGVGSMLSSFYTTTSAATASEAASPLTGLFGGELVRDEWQAMLPSRFDDLDPVWFRNAVGAGIYIVAKDALKLLHVYLKLRQRGKTRVADLPFRPGLVESLELREIV
ncbi:hypothetical protein ACQY0O_001197 [Thecaphora frezii]